MGCSGYRVDLAIVDPEKEGRYLLGVECDGANYHSAKTARDRDRLREGVLRGLGWNLHRVWSSDWWTAPDDCIKKIQAALEQTRVAHSEHETNTPPSVTAAPPPVPDESAPSDVPYAAALQTQSERLPQYRSCKVKRIRIQQEFYLPSADASIQKVIEAVVRQEGPVHLDVLSKRVAAHWGITRLGQNIRDRVEKLIRAARVKRVHHDGAVFLWQLDCDPEQYRMFRIPGLNDEDRRSIDQIAPEEIIAAAMHVLERQISLPEMDLIRETALLFGFQKSGQVIQRTIRESLGLATSRQLLVPFSVSRFRSSGLVMLHAAWPCAGVCTSSNASG